MFSVLLYQCLPVKLSLSPLCLHLSLGRMDVKSLFLGLTDTKKLCSSAFTWSLLPFFGMEPLPVESLLCTPLLKIFGSTSLMVGMVWGGGEQSESRAWPLPYLKRRCDHSVRVKPWPFHFFKAQLTLVLLVCECLEHSCFVILQKSGLWDQALERLRCVRAGGTLYTYI